MIMPSWLIGWGVSVLLLIGMAYLTQHQVDEIIQLENQELQNRVLLIDNYLLACERVADAMASSIQHSYLSQLAKPTIPDELHYLKDYPSYDSYGISGFSEEGGFSELSATLTGHGNIKNIDDDLQKEIVAALSIDSQLGIHTSEHSDFVWAYYTSARNFLLLAPKVRVEDFQFTPKLYHKEFWSLAEPSQNPQHKTIITPLYEDAGGKGLMITVSSPVVAKGQFLGITSVDITLETLNRLLKIDGGVGQNFLVKPEGSIVIKQGNIKLGESLGFDLKYTEGKPLRVNQSWWILSPLHSSDFFVADEMSIVGTYIAAIKKISSLWLLFALVVILIFTLLRLKQALINITDIAHIDQLSSLFNRRGFTERVEHIFLLNQRTPVPWSLLMIDIDHFKKVNDNYSHAVGDQIIMELSKSLKSQMRQSDIVGRWGGEEFVIFLYNTTLDDAIVLANQLKDLVSEQVSISTNHAITVSIGVTEAEQAEQFEQVLNRADKNLYFAKHTGRNKVSAKSTI